MEENCTTASIKLVRKCHKFKFEHLLGALIIRKIFYLLLHLICHGQSEFEKSFELKIQKRRNGLPILAKKPVISKRTHFQIWQKSVLQNSVVLMLDFFVLKIHTRFQKYGNSNSPTLAEFHKKTRMRILSDLYNVVNL